MCQETTTTYSSCLHTKKTFTRCVTSYNTQPRKRGFFASLFSRTPKPSCRTTRTRTTNPSLCTHCRSTPIRTYTSSAKLRFRCSRCVAENRNPSPRNRESNGGMCCAYGITEYAARPPVPPKDKTLPLKRIPDRRQSTREARAAASAAARTYNWSAARNSEMEPGLVREYTNLSGTDTRALPAVPLAPVPVPTSREVQPGIDWERWESAPQTAWGRYPPAEPAPVRPLPTRPLGRDGPGRIETPGPESWSVEREGARTPDSMDIYDVSRPTSPTPRSDSPVSPLTGTFPPADMGHLDVDLLNERLEDAIRYWR